MDQMTSALIEPPHANAGVEFVRAKSDLRAELAPSRAAGRTIGLVPTMGYLHEGHLSLLRAARAECDVVVMSLFVNPTQFGPGEDFERYPRDERRDAELAAEAGVDLVWAPPVEEVYPEGFSTQIEVGGIAEVLCGDPNRRGPEHFRGVATVVAKLFNAAQPDVAYFGQKDAQQVAVIRRMVRDLDFPVRVEALPIVREADGLAMSSRNVYLSPADRERATALSRALRRVEERAAAGSLVAALEAGRRELAAAGIQPEYLEARDPDDLSEVTELNGRPILVAVAARVGDARLIDNLTIRPSGRSEDPDPDPGDTEART
ncbi:MAG TPA: pantoate--beta-alanine ligase [Solirubrobacterales bacterium]|nr:pantoate--beta-alanine ligase [Solirubrobacterales bacterium]